MSYAEEDLLPISALQHLLFCERQCALIHIEGIWVENRLTMEGRHLHERADSGEGESRDALRITRALPIRSLRLGVTGRADIVEIRRDTTGHIQSIVPVEYKRGRPKSDRSDEVQLCAQALCLEEMLSVPVDTGALFYGRPRRRFDVEFTDELRELTKQKIDTLRALVMAGMTPRAIYEPKCDGCSLIDVCLPEVTGASRTASAYTDRVFANVFRDDGTAPEET